MKFSTRGQENYDLLIQVTAWAGLIVHTYIKLPISLTFSWPTVNNDKLADGKEQAPTPTSHVLKRRRNSYSIILFLKISWSIHWLLLICAIFLSPSTPLWKHLVFWFEVNLCNTTDVDSRPDTHLKSLQTTNYYYVW